MKVLSHGRGSAPPHSWVSRHIHPWDRPGPHSTLPMPPAHKGHFGRNIYHPHFMRKKNICLAFERSNMWAWVLPVICSELGPHCAAVTQNHGFLEQADQVCSPRGPGPGMPGSPSGLHILVPLSAHRQVIKLPQNYASVK